jgi:hypothetical protein
LTTKEPIKLADSYGVDIPFDLDRVFIIEQLLDIVFEDETEEEDPKPALVEADIPEPAPLPRQYNITFIEVMIRDPLWVFAFWEIKCSDRDVFEKSPDFGGYYLDVYRGDRASPFSPPVNSPPSPANRSGMTEFFTVPVGPDDNAWYLGFPPEREKGPAFYQVELSVSLGNHREALALSRPFRLPRLLGLPACTEEKEASEVYKNPLLKLSGVEDLRVLRDGERITRIKGGRSPV